jgi:hypothetical protein
MLERSIFCGNERVTFIKVIVLSIPSGKNKENVKKYYLVLQGMCMHYYANFYRATEQTLFTILLLSSEST